MSSRGVVAVTGADGFIGSHLVEMLVREGWEVRALALYNSIGSWGWLDLLPKKTLSGVEVRLGDVRDSEMMSNFISGVDAVLHLAALIGIPYSYIAPRSYVETNVVGTLNVLEGARRHEVSRVVVTSTSEVYGTPDSVPITESHSLKGQSPYSASKIAADKLAEAYALSFEVPVTILRPFNTYGPRQSERAVLPTILRQLLGDEPAVSLGALDTKRDLTYVDDTARGFLRMLEADVTPGTVIQLGTGGVVSVEELAVLCGEVTGIQKPIRCDVERLRPRGSEVMHLESDPSVARVTLGWSPEIELADGIARVARWMREQDQRADHRGYQI